MIRAQPFTPLLLFIFTTLYSLSLTPCTSQSTSNACGTYAICGAFGSCNSQNSPICACLRGFVPANVNEWNSGNWSSGCVRRTPLLCERNDTTTRNAAENNKTDGFLMVKMVKVPGYTAREFRSQSECPGICLSNCSCLAYAHDNDLGCMFWNSTLFDVQKFPSGLGSDLYYRVANSELVSKKSNTKILVAVVVVGVVVTLICLFFAWKWMRRRRDRKRRNYFEEESPPGVESVDASLQEVLNRFKLEELPLFKFDVIEKATDGFSDANRLGKGGFGPVYKGELANGKLVAIKRLSKASVQGMQEFMNEVVLISKLQHRNLVRLLGCCVENKEKMLVYEYMPNKSLDFYLFDQSQQILDWNKRFSIIEGICRGLLYLHRDSRLKIVHRDLKPSNILLDDDWNPKISDFGMARIFGSNQDHVSTVRVVGTYGYMSPEYAIEGRFSEKSDVFSFGVLMLEIVSGRRNTSYYDHESSVSLLGHVWKLWIENNKTASIDERIASPSNRAEIVRCIHIGLLCVQELPRDRPTVSAVLSMLSSEIVELPEPKQVAFALKSSRADAAGTSSSQQSQKSGTSSVNSMTITMIDGR